MESIVAESGNGVKFFISETRAHHLQYTWTAIHQNKRYWYIVRRASPKPNASKIYLHRVILAEMYPEVLQRRLVCDHINGNTLDNRDENLRLATTSLNRLNSGPNAQSSSGYRGVHWNSRQRQWVARLRFNKQDIFLGYFNTPEEASEAYNRAAKALIGDHAPSNRRDVTYG